MKQLEFNFSIFAPYGYCGNCGKPKTNKDHRGWWGCDGCVAKDHFWQMKFCLTCGKAEKHIDFCDNDRCKDGWYKICGNRG